MRFTLSIVAAIALAFAGLAVFVHQRAAAQQRAAAEQRALGEKRASEAAAPASDQRGQPPATVAPASTPPLAGLSDDVIYLPGSPNAPQGAAGSALAAPPAVYGGQPPSRQHYLGGQGAVAAPPAAYGGWSGGPAPYGVRQYAVPQADFNSPQVDPVVAEWTGQDQQLEAEVQSLARQLAGSGDEKERTDLKQKLSAALEKQFDTQQRLRELEVSRIEARVQKLRELLGKRTDQRHKIIDNRYEQLLNDAEGLGWNSAAASGPQYRPQMRPEMVPRPTTVAPPPVLRAPPGAGAPSINAAGDLAANASRRQESTQRLKKIGEALQTYADLKKHYPAPAIYDAQEQPLLSWRVAILPYLGQEALYKEFHTDERWDGERNHKLIQRMPDVYRSTGSTSAEYRTSFVAVIGRGAIFEERKGAAPMEILDGTSNTIVAFEADDEHAVVWTKPDDFTFDPDRPWSGFTSAYPDGRLFLFADGRADFIPEQSLDNEVILRLIVRDDGHQLPPLK